MNEVQVEDWLLKIDIEKTKEVFASIEEVCLCEDCQNFRAASLLIDKKVLDFCGMLGINPHRPSILSAFPVEGNQVMYSGHYHLCGEIVEGAFDEWDIVVGAHCFTLTEQDGGKPKTLTEPYFQIGFEVVLPRVSEQSVELIEK